ncbi:hypothetical protein Efla_001401 [Eimeria flavescens]
MRGLNRLVCSSSNNSSSNSSSNSGISSSTDGPQRPRADSGLDRGSGAPEGNAGGPAGRRLRFAVSVAAVPAGVAGGAAVAAAGSATAAAAATLWLQHEVARLRDEKRLAGEIFSETICSYEEEVRHLKEAVAAAQQQLKAAGAAAAGAVAAAAAAGAAAARGASGAHQPDGGEEKSAAAAAESVSTTAAAAGGGPSTAAAVVQSPSSRSLASSRSFSDRQTQHEDTDDAASVGGSRPGSSGTFRVKKETRSNTRLPSPPEASTSAAGGPPAFRGGPSSLLSRKHTSESLDGKPQEREQRAGGSSLPRISGPKSWKALLFSKDRFGGGKVPVAPDYVPHMGVSSWRSSRARSRGWGPPEEGPQGAPSSAIWVDSVLPDWEAQRETAAFEALLQRGIPHDVRGEVWKRAVGDQLRLTPQYYEMLVARMANARKHLLKTSAKYRERIEGIGGPFFHSQESASPADTAAARGAPRQQDPKVTICSVCGAPTPAVPSGDFPRSSTSTSTSKSGCGGQECCFVWEDEVFGSFLAISADLHRTLPRLGLVDSKPPLHADSSRFVSAASSAAAAADASHMAAEDMPGQDTAAATQTSADADAASAATAESVSAAPEAASSSSNSGSNSNEGADSPAVGAAAGEAEGRLSSAFMKLSLPGMSEAPSEKGPPPAPSEEGRPLPQASGSSGRREAPLPVGTEGLPNSQAVAPLPFGVAGDEKMESFLQTVLESYAIMRPDIGYVQGMAFIAATLLLYMDEYSAFVCFANLMLRRSVHAFYTFNMPAVDAFFRCFDALLEERHPMVLQHLQDLGIETDVFLVDWMYTIFTRCLPFELLGRVWDLFIIKGDVVLFQTSLAIISYFHEELEVGSLDECMAILSPSTTTRFQAIQTDKFLELLFGVRLTNQRLEALLAQVQKTLTERKRRQQGPSGLLLRHYSSEVAPSPPAVAAAAAAAAGVAAARGSEGTAAVGSQQGGDLEEEGPAGGAPGRLHRRSLTWTEGPPSSSRE